VTSWSEPSEKSPTVADDALKELSREARDVSRALKQMGDAAKDAQAPLEGVSDAAEQSAGQTQILNHALGDLAADGFRSAIDAALEFGPALVDAATRAETHQRALQQLGGAYGYVQQATAGAVSAEQAASVQQRVLQSGLRLSAQELAAVTARAREYSRATGTELGQALDQLTDQLINPGEELSRFGVRLQQGMEAGDAMREALRQLQEQAAQTGTSAASLSESVDMASRASREAADAIAGLVAQRLELAQFFTQFASWVTDAARATNGWDEAVTAVVGTLREAIGLRAGVSAGAAQAAQSASGAFVEQAGPAAARLRARGFNLGGIQLGQLGTQATPEQRARLLSTLASAERGGAPGESLGFAGGRGLTRQQILQQQLASLTAEIEDTARMRAAEEAAAARAAEQERQREVRRRNRVAGGGGGAARAAAPQEQPVDVRIERLPSDAAGLASMFGGFSREIERQREARGGTLEQRIGGVSLQRQSAEAELALQAAGMRQGEAEASQRRERIKILREQREALSGLLVEAQREEQTARAFGRPVAEVNGLIQQRIGLQTALTQTTRELVDATDAMTQSSYALSTSQQFVLDKGVEVAGFLGGAFTDAIFAAMDAQSNAGASFAQVMEDQTRAFLRNLARQSVVEALKETALGIGALAVGNVPGASAHFSSAAMHGAVAAAAGIGAAAMGPQPNRAAGATAPATASGGATTAARADDRQTGGGGPLNLTINVSGAAFTDAGVQVAVSNSLREAVGTGVLRREHLNGLFGG
jgi:hypothetical protein